MNNQEIFDKVLAHLRQQGRRSFLSDNGLETTCAYRGGDGLSCAVGCLIPDHLYDNVIEQNSISGLIDYSPEYNPSEGKDKLMEILCEIGISEEQYTLLQSLQRVHDSLPPSDWEIGMLDVADQFNLEYKEPECA